MVEQTGGRTIKSDERVFDIVEHIHKQGSVGVTDLADELDIAKSTAHAHLNTLSQRGYVVNENGQYRIGLQFLRHGIQARDSYGLYTIAQEKVKQLAKKTDERSWCLVEENGVAFYLCGATGAHPVHLPVKVGEWVYLHQIAAGKAILAHLPENQVRRILDRYGLSAKTEHTITDEDELFSELETIRDRGYAFNNQESLRGLHAVSAPICDDNGIAQGALSISGPANRITGEKFRSEFPKLLLGATNELEINVAYS